MSSAPIVLILGAGSNIGQSVAQAFAAKGYKTALLNIAGDLSDLETVVGAFSKVKAVLGNHPSVVVHNVAAVTPNPPNDPLALSLADFTKSLAINTTSAFVAALPSSASRTFIYTGNILNTTVMTPLLDLGVGKAATSHIIQSAATAYADRGFKFYYADERKADGSSAGQAVDGDAHAKLYVGLAEGEAQGPWQQTFVKGAGYTKF
ncbi:hypothetical protein AK830_g6145 [Neonectria ditissima]|uniref:Short chain type dehydrogenase n=1 Tax=Neonectria ditissima TaxID=78410 RepID=A0A0P7B1Q6_9HYPO|nr:hypothetical protein AK830_g6145 [Neonectria ditissima]